MTAPPHEARASELRVSVALATRNGSQFLEKQLASILAQTRMPDELVVSDDDSSDDTLAITRRVVGSTVPLTVLVNTPPLGVTGNFERAVTACTGDLIALSDQDDVWPANRLATMIAEFEARPDLLLLHSDARLVDADGAPLGLTLFDALEVSDQEKSLIHSGSAFDALLRRNVVTGATTVFRRELLATTLPFPQGWVHDEWLAIVASAVGRIDVVDDVLLDYRQHGANQIGAQRLSIAGKVRRVLSEPRTERNARLEANFALLADCLDELDGVSPERRAAAREKAEHERVRNAYPASRWSRLGPILRERATGRYALSAQGSMDIVRDLLQPV